MVIVGLMYALLGLIVSFLLPHIRSLLPPTVAGIVLVLAGLALITPALTHVGIHSATGIDNIDLLIGTVTLTTIVALSVWGKRHAKLLAILIGIIAGAATAALFRSEEHTSELQSLMRISYAVFCLKKKNNKLSNINTLLHRT